MNEEKNRHSAAYLAARTKYVNDLFEEVVSERIARNQVTRRPDGYTPEIDIPVWRPDQR